MTAGASPSGTVNWTTGCCDRTPIMVSKGRFVCRVCGLVWVDTAQEVFDVFGPGVVVTVQPVTREWRMLTHDEYLALYDEYV